MESAAMRVHDRNMAIRLLSIAAIVSSLSLALLLVTSGM
jgi:hypothetical protein